MGKLALRIGTLMIHRYGSTIIALRSVASHSRSRRPVWQHDHYLKLTPMGSPARALLWGWLLTAYKVRYLTLSRELVPLGICCKP